MSATATFDVQMNCGGCSGACTKILNKIDGVTSVNASLEEQKIRVGYDPSLASPEVMLAALKKWGDAGGKKVAMAS